MIDVDRLRETVDHATGETFGDWAATVIPDGETWWPLGSNGVSVVNVQTLKAGGALRVSLVVDGQWTVWSTRLELVPASDTEEAPCP